MNKISLLLAATVVLGASLPAHAGDRERAAVGSLLGGVIGAAVGGNVNGQDGAVVGAVLGATAGSYIAVRDDDRRHYGDDRYYRDYRYGGDARRRPDVVHYGPPPHAPAHGWRARNGDTRWQTYDRDRHYRRVKDERRDWDRRDWDD